MAARRRAPKRYEPVTISTKWLEQCKEHAFATFVRAPAFEHIRRPEPTGALKLWVVLPLQLLKTQNRKERLPAWMLAKKAEDLRHVLGVQNRYRDHRHTEPLAGRPLVLCTRFSSVEPDAYSDGFKWVVDALCVPAGRRKWGLGLLRDDRPKDADVVQWWEPAPQRAGFGLVRVFERGPKES